MSIKFSDSGTVTAVQIADSDKITIPNGDFTVGTLIYTDGSLTTGPQHLINAGNTFSSGYLALTVESSGKIQGITDVNQSGVDTLHQTALVANTAYLIGLQRTGTTVRSFFCPVLPSMPTDGSAVQIGTKSRSLNVGLNLTTALTIGQRANGTNRATHSMARAFCYVGTLSTLDLAKIAHGMDLLDMGKVPLWYVRMNDGSDTADLGPNANPTTRSTGATPLPTGSAITLGYVSTNRPPTITKPVLGSPVQVGTSVSFTTGTADGFPYPTVTQQWLIDGVDVVGATGLTYIPTANDENKFLSVRQTATSQQGVASATSDPVQVIPSVNALYLTPPPTHWMTQHVGGVALVPFSFTYTGVQPATIEYALYDPDGTLRVDWAAAGATIIPGGTGNATPNMPAGSKKYRLAIRGKNSSGTVLATSALSATTFGVGEVIAMIGSSSAETWGYRINETIDPEITSQHRDGAWYMPDRETYGTKMGRYIRSQRGYVVGIIHGGVGGTGLSGTSGWAAENGSLFQGFKSSVLASGGKLGGVFISVGSNDAGSGGVISKTVHIASMRALIQNTRNMTGQPSLPILWSGYNRRTAELSNPNFNASSEAVREAEKVVADDANVYHVQTLDYELNDGIHLTGEDFLNCTTRMSYVWVEALLGRYRRGPKVTAFTYSGNQVFIDVLHRNGTDISPATGGVGIAVTDASGTPGQVSTQRVSATRYSATYDRALVGPVTTKFLPGAAPDWITPIMDNGAMPLPMELETEKATTLATAEPVTPTVTSVTVSPSTATGSTTFSAVVAGTNSPSQEVTWSTTAGAISSAGVFTAPTATSSVQNITVTATSVVDTSKSGTAAVTIAAVAPTPTVTSVTVSPGTATDSATFTATVNGTNSPSQGVTWTASAGSISSSGVFTAPAKTSSVQTITITARSTFDTTKSGTATVTLAATVPPDNPDVTIGVIDATKVPLERRVVFEGSKRVVSFPGSIHKVEF